ncbi:centrosomal protein of 70 kDa-like [Liolophura sinensis]|uniref:centrosomal protein of 70 kDa-like n=1 Tax=Liolophura sinensis TaxID=3198878 RepID=UPI003158B6F7
MANARYRFGRPFDQDDSTSEASSSSDDQHYKTSYQVNDKSWSDVNKSLRHHGLAAVKVLPLSQVSSLSGKVECLEEAASLGLREILLSLMNDCDQRQTLIHDLITKNDQLKEDLMKQSHLTEKFQNKAKDLKVMLESSRSRVEELEHEKHVSSSLGNDELERSRSKSYTPSSRCKQLEDSCQKKELEIEKLRRKLQKLSDEEEKRSLRQNQIFQEFRKRTARAHNVMDEKLLDVIDSYETKVNHLQKELSYLRAIDKDSLPQRFNNGLHLHSTDLVSSSEQGLLKTYEKQLKEARKQLKNLDERNEELKLELEGRPLMKDYRAAQQRIKKLEKVLASNKISLSGEKSSKDLYRRKRRYSTSVDDLDVLPVENCRKYLKDLCKEIGVDDVEDIISTVHKQKDSENELNRFERFALDVHYIVQSLASTSGSRRHKRVISKHSEQLSDEGMDHDLAVIEQWREDERQLPGLQDAIKRLSHKVAPWLRLSLSDDLPVCKLVAVIDRLIEDEDVHQLSGKDDGLSKQQLKDIVSHFQMLFEVPHIAGVFPRMNDLYTKYGEVQNVLHTLRNILGLKEDAKSTAIVDSVGKLCQAHNSTTSDQLRRLLQADDLDSVIRRLEEHSVFFPIFYEVMTKLLDILGLEKMDQVIPAVRALKLLAA